MLLRNLKEEDLPIICNLWNEEYGIIYLITISLMKKNCENASTDLSFIVEDEGEVKGFLIGKIYDNDYEIASYRDTSWISLIFVKRNMRKCGIGKMMVEAFEKGVRSLDKSIIRLGRDINPFFPGLPLDLGTSKGFFEHLGFNSLGVTHDLINRDLKPFELTNNNFTFRKATLNDKDDLIAFIQKDWPGRWTFETIDYFDHGGSGIDYMLCLNEQNQIVGFAKVCSPTTLTEHCSYSLTWRAKFRDLGGIGPLGIDPDYRKMHLGLDIVKASFNSLCDKCSDIIIDWTGLLDFYRRLGFEVWKAYYYMAKPL